MVWMQQTFIFRKIDGSKAKATLMVRRQPVMVWTGMEVILVVRMKHEFMSLLFDGMKIIITSSLP